MCLVRCGNGSGREGDRTFDKLLHQSIKFPLGEKLRYFVQSQIFSRAVIMKKQVI